MLMLFFESLILKIQNGGSVGRRERGSMKNLDYLRTLNAKKMAKFLTAFGAEMVNFCDICPDRDRCEVEDCKYTGRNDEEAWEQWLNAEHSPVLEGSMNEILSD